MKSCGNVRNTPAEQSSRTAKICLKLKHKDTHTHVGKKCKMPEHICCLSNCRFNILSPVQITQRDTITTRRPNHHQQQNIYREQPLLFTRWPRLELNESVGWAGCSEKAPLLREERITSSYGSNWKHNETARNISDGHHRRHPVCTNKTGDIWLQAGASVISRVQV